ncbi:hypothetical protein C8R44DRAFT_852217 [Mycena epipterygia]|nr:hypothetical protein C8R44DRAFT_852217 [Mycena epipterygia]
MFSSSPQNAPVSRPSQQQGQASKASQNSNPAWLEARLFNAKLITAGADAFPFPYVKGIFGTVVFLLEAVQKVKQNQENMKELSHGDTATLKFKTQCKELEAFLQDVLDTVNQLFRTRMQELRSNFMLMATMDTNFQVQEVLTVISPDVPVVQFLQKINNCSSPSKIFHGRQIILQQMHQYFTQTTEKQDIFLLHGLGGAGKTQIALKFIAKLTSKSKNIAKTKAVGGSHSVVSDMEEIDAVDLLLRSAGEVAIDDNKTAAVQIVKVFHYLSLAIVQAIYTTWQISFNQLSQPAATFLQLCSLLHHQGISEQIFKNAATYKFKPSSPSKEELQMPLDFLSQFLGPDGVWDSFCFMDMTSEVKAYSLINFHPQKNMFSIHPLVKVQAKKNEEALQKILGHLAATYNKLQEAEELGVAALKKQMDLLGDKHTWPLETMQNLAVTDEQLGKLTEAEGLNAILRGSQT